MSSLQSLKILVALASLLNLGKSPSSSEPRNLACMTNLTEPRTLSCWWDLDSNMFIPIDIVLHASLCNGKCRPSCSEKERICIPEIGANKCTFPRADFRLGSEINIYITVNNTLGRQTSESLCLDPLDAVKLDPPVIHSVETDTGLGNCLNLHWMIPEFLHWLDDLRGEVRYMTEGGQTWQMREVKSVIVHVAVKLCGLAPSTTYRLQMRLKSSSEYWSEWSNEKTGNTLIRPPTGKLNYWFKEENERNGQIQLFWKPPPGIEAENKHFSYRVYFKPSRGSEQSETIICNTSYLNCSFDRKNKPNKVYIIASNSAGSTAATEVNLDKRRDLEPTESISISINEQHGLKVNWASPKSFPVTGYVIEWWIMSKKFPATNNFKLVGPNVTELDITGNLEPFKLYRVAVYPQYIEGYGCPQFVDAYFKQRAPSIAPALKVGEIGKSHAELIWEEIPLDDRNGFIQTYTIFYRAENGKWSHVNVDGSKRSLILKNLNSSSVYQVFIMASTVEGSINGTIKSINTNILDHGSILITIIPVCIAVVLLLIIAASACLINHRQLKLSFWPTVPDPANSNISKWTPTEERVDTNQTKLQDNNSMNLSKLSFLDVSTKATEGIVQDRPLQSESHGCGQDEMIMNNAFKVTSLDSDNNSGVIQYATVIFSGYKGQNAFQPSYMRSDSTQPLLQDVPTSPNHYENMWFHDTREVSAFTTCTDERNSLTDPELTWEDFPLLRGLTTKEYGQESIC
ncbi:granulocyte colony-stimulating factor receptor-like isoform X2 [Polypterus senegalus]|nr:granulocyte colony-stimulating factor receptor-like isoform X2 [Polypterus senegalus]